MIAKHLYIKEPPPIIDHNLEQLEEHMWWLMEQRGLRIDDLKADYEAAKLHGSDVEIANVIERIELRRASVA